MLGFLRIGLSRNIYGRKCFICFCCYGFYSVEGGSIFFIDLFSFVLPLVSFLSKICYMLSCFSSMFVLLLMEGNKRRNHGIRALA